MQEDTLRLEDDFAYLLSFLPQGWQEKARELGALQRRRKLPDAERLLRVLLIHLAEGCSLRETALRAREGGILQLSDVAVMDRLRLAGEWFRWMNQEIMGKWIALHPAAVFGGRWNVRVIDGTRVKEPGPTGSSWCIHYSIGLPSLACQEVLVCDPHGNGETFKRFRVQRGDLLVGDRAYGVRPGIAHVVERGGDVLVRFALKNLPLQDEAGRPFNLLRRLRGLRGQEIGEWPVGLAGDKQGEPIRGRVCAIRKSRQAAEQALKKAMQRARQDGMQLHKDTLEATGYVFVFTTVASKIMRAAQVLEMYRGRWQIELVFKRLKSILGLGHLRKVDEEATRAWLQGKLFVAFLIETLIAHAESFFPWGYPLLEAAEPETKSLSVA